MKKQKIGVAVVTYCRAVLPVPLLVRISAVVGLSLIWLNLVSRAACAQGAPDIPGYRGIISGPHHLTTFDWSIFNLNASFTREVLPKGEPWGAGRVFQLLGPAQGEVVGRVTSDTSLVPGGYTQVYLSGSYSPVVGPGGFNPSLTFVVFPVPVAQGERPLRGPECGIPVPAYPGWEPWHHDPPGAPRFRVERPLPGAEFGIPVPYEGWQPWHNVLFFPPPPFVERPLPGAEFGLPVPYEGWEPWHNAPFFPPPPPFPEERPLPGPEFGLPVPYEGWEPWHNSPHSSNATGVGVPEPGTLVLSLGAGLGLLGWASRKRRAP